jgi:hypothetical protein
MNRTLSSGLCFSSVVLGALLLAGCAGNHPADQWRKDRGATAAITGTPESGFLGDYSRLRPSPRHADTRYEQSADFARYSAFYVQPIVVIPDTSARGIELSEAVKSELAADAADELRAAISSKYRVVDGPEEGVATVRAAITAVAMGGRSPEGEPWLGGASVEMEVLDSMTGQRVAAAVESDSIDPLDEGRHTEDVGEMHDARMVFRHWSQRYLRWVDAAKSGEMPPTR